MQIVQELQTIRFLSTDCPSNVIFNDTMADDAKRPKMRAVVEMLMTKNLDVVRDVRERNGGRVRKIVQHFVFAFRDKCNSGGTIAFEKGTGFTNPLSI